MSTSSWKYIIYLDNAVFRQNHQVLIVHSLLDILFNVGYIVTNKIENILSLMFYNY